MIPYYLLVFIPAFVYFLSNFNANKNNLHKCTLTTFFFIFFILLSLRNISVGVDLVAYQNYFYLLSDYNFLKLFSFYEPFYFILNYIILHLFVDFRVLIVFIAAISTYSLHYLYKNNNHNPLMTISIFITVAPFSMYFSGLRQVIAMSFVTPLYYLAKSRKIISFLILILIAMQFHQTAFIMLALYPISKFKLLKVHFPIILVIIAAFIFCASPMFNLLIQVTPQKYERYLLARGEAYGILSLLILFLFYIFYLVDEKKVNKNFFILRNILVFSTILQCFSTVSNISMRINYYFLIFIPALIPQAALFYNKDDKNLTLLSKLVIPFGLIAIFFYKAYTSADILNIYPYIFLWE